MSFEADITEIRKLAEAMPKFDPALPSDLNKRKEDMRKAAQARGFGVCKKCGHDLMEHGGARVSFDRYINTTAVYKDDGWEINWNDEELDGSDNYVYTCGQCGKELVEGEDYEHSDIL